MTKTRYTTYNIATHWLNGNLILCNNIYEIDESIQDYMDFDSEDEDGNVTEIMQWFLTSYSKDDVNWLKKTFDLKFTYSEKLNCYVLCVTQWGTSWDYVSCEVLDESILKYNPEIEYKDSLNPPLIHTERRFG